MRPLHLVLDTNVWLDWLVFNDPGVEWIKDAAAAGHATIFVSSDGEAELARVLGYDLSGRALSNAAQANALTEFRAVSNAVTRAACAHVIEALPRCADPDDQKFLELARDCLADWLVTKDGDLLALASRKVRALPFGIVTPVGLKQILATEKKLTVQQIASGI